MRTRSWRGKLLQILQKRLGRLCYLLAEAGESELLQEFNGDPSTDVRRILSAYNGELQLDEEVLSSLSGKFRNLLFIQGSVNWIRLFRKLLGLIKIFAFQRQSRF